MHSRWITLSLLVATWFATAAHAQDRFDVESLSLVTSTQGSVLNVYGGRTLERGAYSLGLALSYGRKPLSIESSQGEHLGDLVGSVGTLQLLGAYGIADRFEIGVALPFHRNSAGSEYATRPPAAVRDATLADSEAAFGDVRIVPRLGLLRHSGDRGLNLALAATLWLPTGSDSAYAGEALRVEPRLALDYRTPRWMLAFNAGYLVRQASRVLGSALDDQVRLGIGADISLLKALHLLGEVNAHLNVLEDDFGDEDVSSDALVGLRFVAESGLVAQLAGGPSIVRGLNSPMYRLIAAIGFEGRPAPPPAAPEPERDADGDTILDSADRCPQEPEDRDGFQDEDGCPDPDNDADGIADASDACPQDPEDRDNFQDDDGCPDPDNDADGVTDANDACPLEVGPAENNGCPPPAPEPPAAAAVEGDKIELRETVLFGNDNAEIQAQSQPLIDAIAKVLVEHPEIELVLVEGHTDDRGSVSHNQKLSVARATSVVSALVARGIDAKRLSSAGFGPSRPIVPNDSAENRAKNRRVELRIERRAQP